MGFNLQNQFYQIQKQIYKNQHWQVVYTIDELFSKIVWSNFDKMVAACKEQKLMLENDTAIMTNVKNNINKTNITMAHSNTMVIAESLSFIIVKIF